MMHILFVSHGRLAEAMISSAEMIAGDQNGKVVGIGLYPNESPESLQEKVVEYLKNVQAAKLLVFTDLVSGTPFNVVGSLMQTYPFRHLSGINLGLLLEAILLREDLTPKELAEHLISMFPNTLMDVNALMGRQEPYA